MKTYDGIEIQLHIFLISAPDEGERQASRTDGITPETHWIVSWMEPPS